MGKMINPKSSGGGSFLPAEYVKNKSQTRANFVALLLFAIVMAGVIGVFVVNHQRWRDVSADAKIVAAQFTEEAAKIDQLKGLEEQRAELLDRAEVVTALIDRVPRSVLMAEIVRSMPSGMTLTVVELEGDRIKPPAPPKEAKSKGKTRSIAKKGAEKEEEAKPERVLPPRFKHTVTIEGLAEQNEGVADFLAGVKASPLFVDVELQLISSTIVDQVEWRKFRVTMGLSEKADARDVAGAIEVELDNAGFGLTVVDTESE